MSGYWLLTGYPYGPGSARQIKATDWPYFGSLVKMLKPSQKLPSLTSVWIPDWMRLNDNVTPAGQTAGFLGKRWEPERFVGDPALPGYQIEGLGLNRDLTTVRIDRRRDLVRQLDQAFDQRRRNEAVEAWDRLSLQAFDLVTSGKARAASVLARSSAREAGASPSTTARWYASPIARSVAHESARGIASPSRSMATRSSFW
ncbi:MAG TPA: hypothetical protein VMG10_07435 [Gemmataceae bacterium]|nr:hypothetical protein [Gemmataceae bacterium]